MLNQSMAVMEEEVEAAVRKWLINSRNRDSSAAEEDASKFVVPSIINSQYARLATVDVKYNTGNRFVVVDVMGDVDWQ